MERNIDNREKGLWEFHALLQFLCKFEIASKEKLKILCWRLDWSTFMQNLFSIDFPCSDPCRQKPGSQEASALGGDDRREEYTMSPKKVSDGNQCSEKGNCVIRWWWGSMGGVLFILGGHGENGNLIEGRSWSYMCPEKNFTGWRTSRFKGPLSGGRWHAWGTEKDIVTGS